MSQPLFSPYQYAPLPESGTWTRVLILHPGLFDDEISISVRQELVSNKCEYEALSYVWGNVEDSGSIIVDIESRLTVARNLLIALQYLRRPDQPRILWIDAICINQQDMDERSRQVTYMYEVYRHAKSVYVWLGLENENSDLGISHLDAIGSPLDLSEDAWRAIFALLNRPYFERLWIRQEV
ncbi:HET-domain-containing protein, partial [Thozetella sp. PMI_491]